MALPLSCIGKADVTIATLVLNTIPTPIPVNTLENIKIEMEFDRAEIKVAIVNIIIPYVNIFFLPYRSANLPDGTSEIAAESK
ncbi:MAG: hypothetical protein AMQ22_02285 [Candidatus Methanofastidiosum methylothiophilum]|uniref:Uncharacterized protein n=1 Tax=Candidatus Methanofastidiosum methylothiophilum TaxID=1705564 RepID=A0A150IHX0_9EURY|nr:MAG: hypothetical protein AMQ22_02285 [Candidatus Methanofastidiosum methylthiophilus]